MENLQYSTSSILTIISVGDKEGDDTKSAGKETCLRASSNRGRVMARDIGTEISGGKSF